MSFDPSPLRSPAGEPGALAAPAISRPGRMPPLLGGPPDLPPPFAPCSYTDAGAEPWAADPGEAGPVDPVALCIDTEVDELPVAAALAAWESAADEPVASPTPAEIELLDLEAEEPDAPPAVPAAPPTAVASDRAWLDALDDDGSDDDGSDDDAPVADETPELPPWMGARDDAAEEDTEPAAEPAAGSAAEPAPGSGIGALVERAVGEGREGSAVAAIAEASASLTEPDAALPEAFAGVFHDVADRLDNIAASLRRRSAGESLAAGGKTDPLELLLTGFVLGYIARQGGDSRPPSGS